MMEAVRKPVRALADLLLKQPTVVRYVFVGGTAFVTDAGTLWLCHGVFGLAIWLATTIAFAAAFVVNFGLNRVLTFTDSG
jgi:putative flippase GtrA